MRGIDLTPSRAIIDVGSNTLRLVVYGGPARAPTILLNEKVTAKLGRGVAETGQLSDKSMAMALAALGRYHILLKHKGIERVDVVATAAVRDATNGGEFLDRVRDIGFQPRLLSGEEEAETSAFGVLGAFPGATGVVADLGGGSLELVDIDGENCSHGVSLPLGTLRLPKLREAGAARFGRQVGKMMEVEHWSAEPEATLYLVGGSFRSFAKYALHRRDWPFDDPHGLEMGTDEVEKLATLLSRKRPEQLAPVPGLATSRLLALPDASALLHVLITKLQPGRLVFSSWGLREGLLFGSLDPALQSQDPMLAGVSAFAEHYGASPSAAAMVAGWTAPANGDGAPDGGERLRLATSMLALASMNVEPNLRPEQVVDWAFRKRWIGMKPKGRTIIAASLLANTGRLDLPAHWGRFASPAELHEGQAWGLAIRLCRRFSGGATEALSSGALVKDKGKLQLVVRSAVAALVNDSVERDLKALGAHLGVKTAVSVIGESAELR
jgi:exopolyphosphatase/guanosine-5'-triphosphate,3'-diphosphate pyrophosphatase